MASLVSLPFTLPSSKAVNLAALSQKHYLLHSFLPKNLTRNSSQKFKSAAIGNGKSNPQIEEIRKKIVRSCQGLPLAISVIGQILSRESLRDWELILREIHSVDNKVSHVLDLSYDNLPSHLQPCFLYFGVFPSDRPVMVDKLHLLWMAEGLISKRMDAAENYFSELVDRNLVIVGKFCWRSLILHMQTK